MVKYAFCNNRTFLDNVSNELFGRSMFLAVSTMMEKRHNLNVCTNGELRVYLHENDADRNIQIWRIFE